MTSNQVAANLALQMEWLGLAVQQYGLLIASMLLAGLIAGFVSGAA